MFVYGTLCALMIIIEISGVRRGVYFLKNHSPFLKRIILSLKVWDDSRVLSSELGKIDDFHWKKNIFLCKKYEEGLKNF